MGLDMYLERAPRYRGATMKDISAVENYLGWLENKKKDNKYSKCTLEEWCGMKKAPSVDYLSFYADHYKAHYSDWDKEHQHPLMSITEQVGYWRKANAIHNWFVNNVQDGVDDCAFHNEVTKEYLEELRDICHEVLCNHDLAESLLPTQSGFFFGSTVYDEWYIDDLKKTIDIVDKVLETTNFDTHMIYYVSSW
jgi:hypothetical protein